MQDIFIHSFIVRINRPCEVGSKMEDDKIGITGSRHKELINRMSELLEASGIGPYISTSQLIDLIADEPTFTKKECVYLGLFLAATNQREEQ